EMRRHRDTDRELPTSYHQRLTTDHCLRLGLRCVRGLREAAGRAIVRARSEKLFSSLDDLHHRVPELRKDELRKLAAVGALNFIGNAGILPAKRAKHARSFRSNALNAGKDARAPNRMPALPAHRRDALWQVERVSRTPGPLY